MKLRLFKEQNLILVLLFAFLIFFLFFMAFSDIDSDKTAEDRIQLEKAIKNAAVSCYAIECAYPPSIDYLVDHYGVQIDTRRFTVKYELYASNLMPDITVLINNYED